MMAATFQEPRGLLIYGARCTGKTTLELNLRKAVNGSYFNSSDFTQSFADRICFIGRTTRKKSNKKILATAGAETLKTLEGIPNAEVYVASVTPGYDKTNILAWFETNLSYVHVICLYSKHRQRYYEKRCKQYTGYCLSDLGPAKLVEPGFGDLVFPFTMEQLPSAFVACLTFLGMNTEREFDYDISSRTNVQ